MKLLTKELIKRFRKIGKQDNKPNPIAVCKFFNAYGAGTWLPMEYNEKTRIFFGWAIILPGCGEYGSFGLDELEALGGIAKIERDLYFTEIPIKEAIKIYDY